MDAQDLYGTRVRLSRDGLAYGEEFMPLDEMDEAPPLSGNLWNPASNLFGVAVFRRHGPLLGNPAWPFRYSRHRCAGT